MIRVDFKYDTWDDTPLGIFSIVRFYNRKKKVIRWGVRRDGQPFEKMVIYKTWDKTLEHMNKIIYGEEAI